MASLIYLLWHSLAAEQRDFVFCGVVQGGQAGYFDFDQNQMLHLKVCKKDGCSTLAATSGLSGCSTYPCGAVSKSVGQWVIVSDFGDSYCIFWACKLVLESLPCVRLPLHNALTQCPSYTDVFEDIDKRLNFNFDEEIWCTYQIRELPIFDLPFVSGHSCAFGVDEKYETDWERTSMML